MRAEMADLISHKAVAPASTRSRDVGWTLLLLG
jgi:hypothetical protein